MNFDDIIEMMTFQLSDALDLGLLDSDNGRFF